jgi:esterase/lipase superfamily enzyme
MDLVTLYVTRIMTNLQVWMVPAQRAFYKAVIDLAIPLFNLTGCCSLGGYASH